MIKTHFHSSESKVSRYLFATQTWVLGNQILEPNCALACINIVEKEKTENV